MVFVIQENPNINIVSAREFGEFSVLLPPGQIMFSPGPVVFELNQKLVDFNDDDYLLCTGDPAAIGISCAIAANYNQGRVKLLKWDRETRKYYPVAFDIHQKEF